MEATNVIAICAAIIATASLFVAVRQTSLTRRHNRLSVRPVLSMYRMEFKNKPVEYILRNQGIGPATIKKFEIILDDKIVSPTSGNIIYDLVAKLDIPRENVTGHLISENEPISSGKDISIVQFTGSDNNEELNRELVKILPRVKFRITYTSMYEEYFVYEGNGS